MMKMFFLIAALSLYAVLQIDLTDDADDRAYPFSPPADVNVSVLSSTGTGWVGS